MEEKEIVKKNNNVLTVLLLIIFTVAGFAGGYFLNNYFNENDNKEKTEIKEDNKEEKKLNYEFKDTGLQADENGILKEQELYIESKLILKGLFNNVTLINDALIFSYHSSIYELEPLIDLYVVTNDGIMKKIVGKYNNTINDNVLTTSGDYIRNYEIKDNKITINSSVGGQDMEYIACKHENKNEIMDYVEEIEYLGNGKVSSIKLISSNTYEDYIKNNNLSCEFID